MLIRLFALLLLSTTAIGAQGTDENGRQKLSGIVYGPDAAPVTAASLTVSKVSKDSLIAWAITDIEGQFEIEVPAIGQFLVRTQSLGLRPDTLAITSPYPQFITIRLGSTTNRLPQSTVTAERLPIIEVGDTTTYNVGTFRDSTDRKVEEVLKKLPGVVVKGDGSIEVNGRPLHRLLVEGSDLFGADYQLGTKNINAKDIGRVEVIRHYEDNPVLRSVNTSQDVVLNLKLEEKVKAAVAGSVLVGVGYGDEAKYTGYASLYRIARAEKTIFIGNANNIGSGITLSGTADNYSSGNGLRTSVLNPLDLSNNPSIATAGLSPAYTDNSNQAFGTLRHHGDLAKGWKVTLNASIDHSSARQTTSTEQTFTASEDVYALRTLHDWSAQNRYLEGELLLNKLSATANTSYDFYLLGSVTRNNFVEQYFQDERPSVQTAPLGTAHNLTARGRLVHSLRPGLVTQVDFYAGEVTQTNEFNYTSPVLDTLLDELTVVPEYRLTGTQYGLNNTWLKAANRHLLQAKLGIGSIRYSEQGADRNFLSVSLGDQVKLPKKILITGNVRLQFNRFLDLPDAPATTYNINGSYEQRLPNEQSLNASVAIGTTYPSPARQFTDFGYVYDAFQIIAPAPPTELVSNRLFTAFYERRNSLKFTNTSVRVLVQEVRNATSFSGRFIEDISLVNYGYGLNTRRAQVNFRRSIFVKPIKSNVALRLGTGLSETEVRIGETDQHLRYLNSSVALEAGYLILPNWRLKGQSGLLLRQLLNSENGSTRFITWTSDLQSSLRLRIIEVISGLSHQAFFGQGRKNSSFGVYVGVQTDVDIKEREVRFTARLYNPFNRDRYDNQYTGDIFTYTFSVPALPRYFVVSADWSL